MSGERHLPALLADMNPQLREGEYVFCSIEEGRLSELDAPPQATFQEAEGLSVVVPRQAADQARWEYDFVARMITLQVHSSLEAVGFVAAVAGRLAEAGIGANPVSATYHDHLFIAADMAQEAMLVLKEMSDAAARAG